MKSAHESQAHESGEIAAPSDIVTALKLTDVVYESGSTHIDFRNAVIKVGGEAGGPSSGAGGGGVLTIVGLASLPPSIQSEMDIDLAGESGQSYGAGGGGAGSLNFVGRPATVHDTAAGLSVPLFFPANTVQLAGGLFSVFGAGCDHLPLDEIPNHVSINVAITAEFGSIAVNTLLGFQLTITDAEGVERGGAIADVAVPEAQGAINRNSCWANVPFEVKSVGTHTLSLLSGGQQLAQYEFDVRLR